MQIAPGPCPDLDRVGAGVDQRLGSRTGRDVAGDHLELARQAGDARDHLEHAARMSVRGVDDEHVGARGEQRLRALDRVRADADGGADAQPPLRILGRVRELDALRDVLDRDQPAQHSVGVDDRQLLDAVPVQQLLRLAMRRADRRRHEVARGHQVGDRLREIALEAQVAVGEDADEAAALVGDRDAGDVVALHQLERVGDERVRRQRQRLDDQPGLGALDAVDLADLRLDRQVAVHDADPAFARERDRHARLGDGVHRRRDDRRLEHDRARQPRRGRDVVRQHRRLRRDEQDVVEGQPFLRELLRKRAPEGVEGEFPVVHPGRIPAAADYASTGSSSETSTPACRRPACRGSNLPAPTSRVDAAPVATAARSASAFVRPA